MSFLATTTVTVLRGTATDRWGDDIDTDTVFATRQPASILERPVTGGKPASGRRDTPRTYALRIRTNIELRQDDRIRDERTGRVYTIDTLAPQTNPAGHSVTRADLLRVT